MSFDPTKYHCQLNGVNYMINGYQKNETPTFIPRLSSGDQSESDFNLYAAETIDGFGNGGNQRFFEDKSSIAGSEGLYPIYDDDVLYPVEGATASTGLLGTAKAFMSAKVVSKDYAFFAYQTYSAPTNYIRRIDANGTVTNLTLPSSLSGASNFITSMVIWQNQLWISTSTDGQWYMDLSSTTVNAITSGSGYLSLLVVYKGNLYGTGGASTNAALWRYTGNTSTRSYELVANSFKIAVDPTASLFVYNNRIILTRKDGMYAYDGIQMVDVETQVEWNDKNYMFPAILKGYLYYFMPDGWYRYNGSLIEKLYDIEDMGYPVDVFTGKNRIWLLFSNSQYSEYTRYDKMMGYDNYLVNDVEGRISAYNGKGMYTYARTATFVRNPAYMDFNGQGEVHAGFWFNDKIYITELYEKDGANEYFTIDTDEINRVAGGAVTTQTWRIVTSIMDNGFASIFKTLGSFEIFFDGYRKTSMPAYLNYRTYGFDGSIGFSYLTYDFTNSSQYFDEYQGQFYGDLWDKSVKYKQIQFQITPSTAFWGVGIKGITFRYMLLPEMKFQWRFTALCYGNDSLAPLQLADGSEETASVTVRDRRAAIYNARTSDDPVTFVDVDSPCKLALDIDDTTWDLEVDTVSMLKGTIGYLLIDDEIIQWNKQLASPYLTATNVYMTRGAMGTTEAAHTAGTPMYNVYPVIVRQIVNERIELDDGVDTADGLARGSEITLLLQEV